MRLSSRNKTFLFFYFLNLALLLAATSCAGAASAVGGGGAVAASGSDPAAPPTDGIPGSGSDAPMPIDPMEPGGGIAGGGTNGDAPVMSGGKLSGNPFVGASMYLNPDYAKGVLSTTGATSADQPLMQKAARYPTAVWLDRMAAIAGGAQNNGRLSLTGHLDAALAQASKANQPVVVSLVVYDLPGRDCAAIASNGELPGTAAGLQTYKASYIDPIVAALTAKPEYQKLRIVLIVEPDSIPNMVTNLALPKCAAIEAGNLYVSGVTYAIQKLSALPNSFVYLDIGHSGWLGWPMNMQKAATLYTKLINDATANKPALVRGLADNISNYTPLKEPFVSSTNMALLSGPFYQSNPVFDESTFVTSLTAAFKAAGYTGTLGFITDTSRNGWPQVNDGKPIDRRKARGNWCNILGGIGARPQAAPPGTAGVDAYLFVKPPGESDGGSTMGAAGFDPACVPGTAANMLDGLPDAPPAGKWFSSEFLALLRRATPAI